jgi:hypothetical protein
LRIGRDSGATRKHGYADERQESAKKTQSRAICSFHSTIIGSGLIAVERAKSHDHGPELNCTLVTWMAIIEVAGRDLRSSSLSVTSVPRVDSDSEVSSGKYGHCVPPPLFNTNNANITATLYTSVTLNGNQGNYKYPIVNYLVPIS